MAGAIANEVTGRHFEAGNSHDLARVVTQLHGEPETAIRMRGPARSAYLNSYTSDRNYAIMMDVYTFARKRRHESAEGDR